MPGLEMYFLVMLGIQLFHSLEELTNKFHEKFPLFPMTFRFFLTFEVCFYVFWASLYFIKIPAREQLMAFFLLLMFTNGLWHIVWYCLEKKYVPGLVTAPLFIVAFLFFYFQNIA